MTTLSTSSERIDALTRASDQIYPILEQRDGGEIRARRIVRLGMASVATTLRRGDTPSHAGARFDRHLAHELRTVDYDAYAPYRTPPKRHPRLTVPADIAILANRYSDTLRGTQLADHSSEPDSIHALHLAALAVPYARAHYPDLDPGKVALYSLLHDLPEAYAGDVPTFNISPRELELKRRNEALAIAALRSDYGAAWPEIIGIVEAYEALDDDEAKFVKAIDKNDPGYTHFRNGAHALRARHGMRSAPQFLAQAHANIPRTLAYSRHFPLVLADRYELTGRIATLIEQ